MHEALRKGDYFKHDGLAIDFNTIIATVVEEVWDHYDSENSGVLDKEQCRTFVEDTIAEMSLSGIEITYCEKNFN
jgi:hypothetical protein